MEMRWRYILLYLVVIASYAFITLTSPVTGNTYNLSRFQLSLLQMSFILPIIIIWYLGVTSASGLKRFVADLEPGEKRDALGIIANGILVLVTGLILTSLLGTARPYALENGWIEQFRIASNYLSVLFPLIGMFMVYRGSARLLEVRGRAGSPHRLWWIGALGLLFAGLVAGLSTNEYRNASPDPAKYQSFYLSDPLIIGTILLPYLAVWIFGVLAALNIRLYQPKHSELAPGFRRLSSGILTIIGSLIFIQALGLFGSILRDISLGPLLLIVYALLFVYGGGYFLIASAARKLNQPQT